LVEPASDDLSVLIEGSTRTRANILTYKTPDVMISSIQNGRPGQLNFQSSVNMATLNAGVSVFTTAGLEDIDISDLLTTVGGAAAGGLIGTGIGLGLTFLTGGAAAPIAPSFAAMGATAGPAVGLIGNEEWLTREELLVEHEDGPGWWTGSWALPMVVQHDSAAILIYQFHEIHHVLADCGCHAWFPKARTKGVEGVALPLTTTPISSCSTPSISALRASGSLERSCIRPTRPPGAGRPISESSPTSGPNGSTGIPIFTRAAQEGRPEDDQEKEERCRGQAGRRHRRQAGGVGR
jgi:hypothetical protein